MGKAQRDKGARFERELVNTAKAHGLDAKRVPLSGAAEGFKNDVLIDAGGVMGNEAKKRGAGLSYLRQLDGSDVLIGADRRPALAALIRDFCDLLAGRFNATQFIFMRI